MRKRGAYTLRGELGDAGMSRVFVARDEALKREIVVKCVHVWPENHRSYDSLADLFLREMEIAAGLTHPNIVSVLFSGSGDGLLFYTMPRIAGESLRQRLARSSPLFVPEAIAITQQVASALEAAHKRHIAHCDVKPANILLSEGRALVTDFGIARVIDETVSSWPRMGTPAYMSPEQREGTLVDHRTDIYSLACVLYEMLTGHPPSSATVGSPAKKLNNTVAPFIAEALGRALATEPNQRFESVLEFATALQPAARTIRVAVLPFRSLGAESWLGEAIADVVLNQLGKVRGLEVVARRTAFATTGDQVGVLADYLVDGSVQLHARMLRLTARLTALLATTRETVLAWSDCFDHAWDDFFAAQREVADAIASELHRRLEFSGAVRARGAVRTRGKVSAHPGSAEIPPPPRATMGGRGIRTRGAVRVRGASAAGSAAASHAVRLYLQARQALDELTGQSLARAGTLLGQALERAPDFGPAIATLARVIAWAGIGLVDFPIPKQLDRARDLATRALELNPYEPEALFARGVALGVRSAGAEAAADLDACLTVNASFAEAYAMRGFLAGCVQRRFAEGLADLDRATTLDPAAAQWRVMRANILHASGEPAQAERAFRDLMMDERAHGPADVGLAMALVRLGRVGEALDLALATEGANASRWLGELAYIHGMAGDHVHAHDCIRRLEQIDDQLTRVRIVTRAGARWCKRCGWCLPLAGPRSGTGGGTPGVDPGCAGARALSSLGKDQLPISNSQETVLAAGQFLMRCVAITSRGSLPTPKAGSFGTFAGGLLGLLLRRPAARAAACSAFSDRGTRGAVSGPRAPSPLPAGTQAPPHAAPCEPNALRSSLKRWA